MTWHGTGENVVHIDTKSKGCVCTGACEHPCFLRIGLTDRSCCPGCAPLPPVQS